MVGESLVYRTSDDVVVQGYGIDDLKRDVRRLTITIIIVAFIFFLVAFWFIYEIKSTHIVTKLVNALGSC
jgi:hypothetical protein